MNTKEAMKSQAEYVSVPLAQLRESSTNPRKTFDSERLAELAESIREKGVLSPLVVRPVDEHLEIVAGARRYRAAQQLGLEEVPVRVVSLTDAEAQEIQIVENLQRSDLHPFEEARGFRAILEREGTTYTVERIAAKVGKPAAFVARRIKLLDLIEPVAASFTAGQIGIEHALLIAKLPPDVQDSALAHCFDGYFAGNAERSLAPVSSLQAWIEHNILLSLKSVPFSKDDATLVPEAGSCTSCPKRTGFNTLLFSEIRQDCCTDKICFNLKLNRHIAERREKTPDLVMISEQYNVTGETPVLASRNYVEVIARKTKQGKSVKPAERVCSHLKPAIHVDGIDKGRIVKVCANLNCPIHFKGQREQEKRELQWKADQKAAKRRGKETVVLRQRILNEVLKRAKPPFGVPELRLVAQHIVGSLSHDLACRLAKRHGIEPAKKGQEWELAERARSLYKTAEGAALAALLLEAMLLALAGNTTETKDDLLAHAAKLYKVDVKALRRAALKTATEKTQNPKTAKSTEKQTHPKPKSNLE